MSAAFFISHGSPMLALEDNVFTRGLANFGKGLRNSRAIIVMSAHSRGRDVEVSTASMPATIYDFGGFPAALSEIVYPAPGSAEIAEEVLELLKNAGIPAGENPSLGFDHGVWTPLVHMLPAANIPIVSMAMPRRVEPGELLKIGAALAPLRRQGVALMGSGSITHNLGDLSFQADAPVMKWAHAFDQWVHEQLAQRNVGALTRFLSEAPDARHAHPTWEHFAPLFFVLGAVRESDSYRTIVDGFQHGTLSMRSFVFE